MIENTMRAFEAAVDLGFRYVETDVHVTADDRLVAFHDERLDRVTDREGLIRELPWSEVAAARVGALDTVPLLEDVLGTWPDLRVNIDPKHDTAVDGLIEVIKRTNARNRVCVGSFAGRRISRVRGALGDLFCTAMGPGSILRLRLASFGLPMGGYRSQCAQVPVGYGKLPLVDRRFVEAAHRRSIQVHVWTIDDEAEMHRLLDLGVDGVMTDQAGRLRAVLQQRGAWH